MLPTILILSALLLSLIPGSTGDGQRMGYISTLQQTLQYWWKIYKKYNEEVTLGSCWASYLFKKSTELSKNQPVLPKGCYMECPQNPFPQIVTANATTPSKETRKGKHPREGRLYASARSTISKFTNDPDRRGVASRTRIIRKPKQWTVDKIERVLRAISNNYTERNKIDENERIVGMIGSHIKRRRRTLRIVPELLRRLEAPRGSGHEFSSRGTSSHAVNPTPNPKDDDKVDSGSTDFREKDSRRKVLRSLTSHRDSYVEDVFASRSFSLKDARGESLDGRRFPFQRHSSSRERNSRVDDMPSYPWVPREDHGIEEGDPAGRRAPSNNDGSSSSHSHFREVNAEYPRMSVVKLMDSEGNSSCEPTINPKTLRRKPEELSRDSLLSPRERIAGRSLLESRGSGGEDLKRHELLQFKIAKESDTKKPRCQQPREKRSSRSGRDVSTTTIHPTSLSELERSHQRMLYEKRSSLAPAIPQKSKRDDHLVRATSSVPSLVGQFIGIYENLTNQSTQHSKAITLRASQNQDNLSLQLSQQSSTAISSPYTFVISIFRILGRIAQIGRRIIDAVEMNEGLVCTKEYLWTKIIKWIDPESYVNA